MLVTGAPGGGASALVTNWAADWAAVRPGATVVIQHCDADAAAGEFRRLDLDHVPRNVLGFDHGLDLGLLAVVFDADDLGAGGLLEGLDIGLLLRVAIGTAEVDDGQLALGQGRQAGGKGTDDGSAKGLYH